MAIENDGRTCRGSCLGVDGLRDGIGGEPGRGAVFVAESAGEFVGDVFGDRRGEDHGGLERSGDGVCVRDGSFERGGVVVSVEGVAVIGLRVSSLGAVLVFLP